MLVDEPIAQIETDTVIFLAELHACSFLVLNLSICYTSHNLAINITLYVFQISVQWNSFLSDIFWNNGDECESSIYAPIITAKVGNISLDSVFTNQQKNNQINLQILNYLLVFLSFPRVMTLTYLLFYFSLKTSCLLLYQKGFLIILGRCSSILGLVSGLQNMRFLFNPSILGQGQLNIFKSGKHYCRSHYYFFTKSYQYFLFIHSMILEQKWVGTPFAAMFHKHLSENNNTNDCFRGTVVLLSTSFETIQVKYSYVALQVKIRHRISLLSLLKLFFYYFYCVLQSS